MAALEAPEGAGGAACATAVCGAMRSAGPAAATGALRAVIGAAVGAADAAGVVDAVLEVLDEGSGGDSRLTTTPAFSLMLEGASPGPCL